MIAFCLALLLSIVTGAMAVAALIPGTPWSRAWGVFKLSLGAGIGLGLSSVSYSLWTFFFRDGSSGLQLMDGGLLLVAALCHPRAASAPEPPPRRSIGTRVLAGLLGFTLLSSLLAFVEQALRQPHGAWDAWAIWDYRARFLFRGGAHWVDGFAPQLATSHPDYPLLLPALVARGWTYAGSDHQAVPVVLALLFALATVGLLVSALSLMRGEALAYLGGMALLAAPFFIQHSASLYADGALAFFFLAAVAVTALADRLPPRGAVGGLALVGLAGGLAAWTKNEGLQFLLPLLLVQLLPHSRPMPLLRRLFPFACGLAPLIALDVFFKVKYAPANDLIAGLAGGALFDKLFDLERHRQILKAFVHHGYHFGLEATVALAAFLILAGFGLSGRPARASVVTLFVLASMLVGYVLVYVLTPHDLSWHLATSLDRLLFQLWPLFVLAVFLVVASPAAPRDEARFNEG